MAKAGIYHTDTEPTEINDLEAITFSVDNIRVNSGIATLSNLTLGISTSIDSPLNNNQLKFYLTSNNQLSISVRGSDGIVRIGIVSLT